MDLATIIHRYGDALERQYGPQLLPSHHRALQAIIHCPTATAGEVVLHCPECHQLDYRPRSCGSPPVKMIWGVCVTSTR